MSLPKYQRYRDSDVPWLGALPRHWAIQKVRRLCEIKKRIVGELGYDVLSVTQGGLRVKDLTSNDGQLSMDYSKYQRVEVGDFAMNHMDLLTGYVDIASAAGVTSPDYRVFAVRDASICYPRYLLYLFQMGYKNRIFFAYGQGSSQLGRWRLPTDQFNELPIPLPPMIEQQAIVAFLDDETTKIDALVAAQQQLLQVLREKRRAVVSRAVTKGLNSDAKLKHSGVQWIGDIPARWIVKPLSRVTVSRCDGPFGSGLKSEHYTESGVRVIRLQNIRADGFSESDESFIDANYYRTELAGHDVVAGDLLIAGLGDERNTVGRACVAPKGIEPAMVKADCFRFRLDVGEVVPEFVAAAMNSGAVADAGFMSSGSTRSRISLSKMANRKIPVPPVAEQAEIARHIQLQTRRLDALKRKIQNGIDLLLERRSALIAAAVTGQIDVQHIPIGAAA